MKKMQHMLLTVFTVLIGLSTGGYSQDQASPKVGYVNFDEVVRQYYKTVVYQQQMQQEATEEEGKLKNKIEEINRMKQEMELLSDDARAEKEKLLQLKIAEAQGQRDQTKRDFQRKAINSMNEIFNEIYTEIEKQGKDGGYTFIFRQKIATPAIDQPLVLYGAAEFDLTDDIIEALNKDKPEDIEIPDNEGAGLDLMPVGVE